MSNSLCYQPKQEVEACFLSQCQPLNPQLPYSHLNHGNLFSKVPTGHCSDQESSLSVTGSCNLYNSPASQLDSISYPFGQHYSPDNTTYGSPMSGSCITGDTSDLRHKLQELETAMLGPDSDQLDTEMASMEMDSWGQVVEMIARKDLKRVLITCAKAVSDNDLLITEWLMDELRQMVSVSGEPIQRLGAYMLEGLVAKRASSALRCNEPACADLLSYMHILYEVCPYIKFGYMSANGAIAEAMKNESRVHIVDFRIGQGIQWVTLIQAFAARPGGPPRIRITGIDDVYSAYARGGGLHIVGWRLQKLAESFKVPFQFHAAAMDDVLRVQPGEALAVNFGFALHHTPENHRDRVLTLVKSLSPKVVTLVEQECDTNSAAFFPRFVETLDYYTAMFESIDVTLPRDHKDRINVEQHCLARDVVNLIACEGGERVERHELLEKWRSRFAMAGFRPYPLSSLITSTIKKLLRNYCDKYRLEERDGALCLGWMHRNLVASCAWQCTFLL